MGVRRTLAAVAAGLALVASGCGGRAVPEPAAGGPAARTALPPTPSPTETSAAVPTPAFASQVPASTSQVIRTVSSDRWCRKRWCTVTQAWERDAAGAWRLLREFRSTISPGGWGKESQDDMGTPAGVFRIKITFSTSAHNPGRMPWRRRLPTSTVTDEDGPFYNTWIEEPGRTDGDRPSMRWGFVVDYNNVRIRPGVGPAPVPHAGSGIFYHTSRPGKEWVPSEGCTQLGNPADMHWLLTWLDPKAHPRVVQGP
jgi:L,D-peptidoglycan transpeptidase YkuD (ErfK/YbiS/YcfS/YnhG family)